MLFLVHFEILPEHRDQVLKRVREIGDGEPASVKIIGGAWYSVTQLEGWVIVESTDSLGIAQHLHAWTDLNIIHVTPVLTTEDALKLFS